MLSSGQIWRCNVREGGHNYHFSNIIFDCESFSSLNIEGLFIHSCSKWYLHFDIENLWKEELHYKNAYTRANQSVKTKPWMRYYKYKILHSNSYKALSHGMPRIVQYTITLYRTVTIWYSINAKVALYWQSDSTQS